jgi:hypothetical protein
MGSTSAENRAGETSQSSSKAGRREDRGVWILTIYGISGLALFGVLAYYFSSYIAH